MTTMTKVLHTPGPWRAIVDAFDHSEGFAGHIEDSRGYALADVYIDTDNGFDPPSFEEAQANAHLLADAPALLDALREVLRYDDPCDHEPDPKCCTHCHARELVARHTREG